MRVLIAPNAFKGSLSALEASRRMALGVRRAFPAAEIDLMPISDGGDGLMEVLLARCGGRRVKKTALDALGRPRPAAYAVLKDGKTAVVEMAQASGLARLKTSELDPLSATSFGTGELIRDALRRGCRTILVGLGGSASSDGGAGMAAALGARFSDSRGRILPLGAKPLLRLEAADRRPLRTLFGGVKVLAVSDVTNPLLGPRGSARVYGPQKGASPAMVAVLERALARYAAVLKRDLGVEVARLPGGGAAGGLGAGLAAFLGAAIVPGADWVLKRLGAGPRLAKADFALTGEGKADEQSFYGKAPLALARLAEARGVPVLYLCGQIEGGVLPKLRRLGIRSAALASPGEAVERSMKMAGSRLPQAAAKLLRAAVACAALGLAALPARANSAQGVEKSSAIFAQADFLYFHRHQEDNLQRSVALLEERAQSADAAALWRLGRGLVRMGERQSGKERIASFQRARDLLSRAVKLTPQEPEAHYWLGMAMGRIGEARGVMHSLFLIGPLRREMRRVLELDPHHGGAHHVLGEMLRQIPRFAGGSKAKAVAELETALRLSPNHTGHYPALAQAYLDAGRRDKAREVLRRIFSVKEPDDPGDYEDDLADARRMLKALGE